MSGALKGLIVGFVNTLVVALCIAAMSKEGGPLFFFVVLFGAVPGALTGALLGHIAELFRNANRMLLLAIMIAISCFAVALLGDTFETEDLVFVSCFPTAAACSILERWTRGREPLPNARLA